MLSPSMNLGAPSALYPRLWGLIERAQARAAAALPPLGLVYPCDALAMQAADAIASQRVARPVLIGPRNDMERAAELAGVDMAAFECVYSHAPEPAAAGSPPAAWRW